MHLGPVQMSPVGAGMGKKTLAKQQGLKDSEAALGSLVPVL